MKKMFALLIALMTALTLMIPMFASAEEPAEPYATMWVNCADGKRLNVRTEPKTGSKILYRLDCGTCVCIDSGVAAPKGWAYVTTSGHTSGGFVMTKFLQNRKPGKYEITERDDGFRAVTPYIVSAKALNDKTMDSVGLRTIPNKTAKMIRRLSAGDFLQVIAVGKTWSQVIDLATGMTGYVANDYMIRM
ncbi:MAG: SH3 domain-containing protein [Clostridia bacterium]|nr:SH3 domain-containing protein [Clostridia bacterium]